MQKAGFLERSKVEGLLPSNATAYTFPDLALRSPWPFDGNSGLKDPQADKSDLFHDEDGALALLRLVEPDKRKRLRRYLDLDFPEAKRVDRIIESQTRFLSNLDADNTTKIGEFLERHYRNEQLFYSSGHPAGKVFKRLVHDLNGQMGFPEFVGEIGNVDHWREWSVPIHPVIAQRLSLSWAGRKTLYHYGTFGYLSWEDWVGQYIDTYG